MLLIFVVVVVSRFVTSKNKIKQIDGYKINKYNMSFQEEMIVKEKNQNKMIMIGK